MLYQVLDACSDSAAGCEAVVQGLHFVGDVLGTLCDAQQLEVLQLFNAGPAQVRTAGGGVAGRAVPGRAGQGTQCVQWCTQPVSCDRPCSFGEGRLTCLPAENSAG